MNKKALYLIPIFSLILSLIALFNVRPASEASYAPVQPGLCQCRLTLTSGTPVTVTDQTAKTSVFLAPFRGNLITLYDGASWRPYTFVEITISVPASTATNYDVFAFISSGSITAESVAWTDGTTRATALTTQNGAYVKTGTLTKLYIGTYRTTASSGQTEDSKANRLVWNNFNRVARQLKVVESTSSWSATSTSWQSWNQSTNNRVTFVRGLDEDVVDLYFGSLTASSTSDTVNIGIGLDSTSATGGDVYPAVNASPSLLTAAAARYTNFPGAGFHFLQLLQITHSGTTTYYGNISDGTKYQGGAVGLTFQ